MTSVTSVTSVTSGPVIPGMPGGTVAAGSAKPASSRYQRSQPPAASAAATGTAAQQAFIHDVAPGAIAAQHSYGVPAAVTIAQAIDESAWGQSSLAAQDNNMFGIKGSGPAGSVSLPTQEFENGQWVTITAQFRVYNNVAESIADHANLLATSGYYGGAMASRQAPNSFAQALAGVYATDPNYGNTLVGLMRRFNLYRFDPDTQSATAPARAAAHPASASAAQATAPQSASDLGRPGRDPRTRPGLAAGPGSGNVIAVGPAAQHRQADRRGQPGRCSRLRRDPRRRPHPSQSARRPRLRSGHADRLSPDGAPLRRHLTVQAPALGGIAGRRDSAAGGHRAGPGGPASTQTAGHRSCSHAGQPAPDRADARDGGRADAAAPGRGPIPRGRYWISRPRPIRQRGRTAPTRTGSPSGGVPHPFATPPTASSAPSGPTVRLTGRAG